MIFSAKSPMRPSKSAQRRYLLSHHRRNRMKISARNRLKGKIVEVILGATTAHVRIDVGGSIITAAITNDAVNDLGLAAGQEAYAVIKASDVMVAIDD